MTGDRRGGEAYWRKAVAGQPGSGLGIRAYCQRRKLAESAFYYWRRRLKEEALRPGAKGSGRKRQTPVRFATVTVTPAATHGLDAGEVEAILPGGIRLRFGVAVPVDRAAALLKAFAAAPSAGEADMSKACYSGTEAAPGRAAAGAYPPAASGHRARLAGTADWLKESPC